jgi:hypothetical protein
MGHFPAGWLWRWWHRQPRLDAVRVVLYTRQGCHLCDVALAELERWRWRYGFRLDVRDVDGDAGLVMAYGTLVPVVVIDGRVRFRGAVNRVLLLRLLRAAGSAANRLTPW